MNYMRVLGVACLGCINPGSSNVGVMSWTWVVDIRGGAVCVAWFSFDWRFSL